MLLSAVRRVLFPESPLSVSHVAANVARWASSSEASSSTSASHEPRRNITSSSQHNLYEPPVGLQPPAQRANYPAKYAPWAPSNSLHRLKHPKTRMGFLMQTLEEEQVQASLASRPIPDFKAGDVLEVRMVVPEAGRKEYLYQGVCIARYNKGIRSAFKIFNVLPDSGGFVQHLPLYMPDLLEIKIVGRIPARRAKLYYLLDSKRGSSMKFQPHVVNMSAIKPEDGTGGKGSDKTASSKKGKKK